MMDGDAKGNKSAREKIKNMFLSITLTYHSKKNIWSMLEVESKSP